MISSKFIKSSLIYTIAGALPMASAIILLPFYIQDLSTAMYGKLAIFLAFSLLVQIVVTYSFDSSVFVHFHEYKKDTQKLAEFISSAFVLMTLIGVGLGVVLAITGELLFSYVLADKNISFFPYGFASVVTGIFQAVFKVHSSLLQTREKPEVFFWSNLGLFTAIALLTIGGLQAYPNSMVGPIGGRLIASVILGSWVFIRIFREFGLSFNFSWLKTSLEFNNYVFIYQIEQWIINYFDRILVSFSLGLTAVGIYDFALKCLVGIELLMNGLHNSFYPKVVSAIIDNDQKVSTPEINRYYHGLVSSVMILVCLSILVLPVLIQLFVNKSEYIEAVSYIPLLAILYLPRVMRIYFGVPYSAKKYTKPLPLIYFIVSLVKIGGITFLVSDYGIKGVIFSGALAAFIEVILLRTSMRKKFSFRFNTFKMVLAPLALFVIIVVGEIFIPAGLSMFRHLFYLVLCFLILWSLYRNEVLDLLSMFSKKWLKKS